MLIFSINRILIRFFCLVVSSICRRGFYILSDCWPGRPEVISLNPSSGPVRGMKKASPWSGSLLDAYPMPSRGTPKFNCQATQPSALILGKTNTDLRCDIIMLYSQSTLCELWSVQRGHFPAQGGRQRSGRHSCYQTLLSSSQSHSTSTLFLCLYCSTIIINKHKLMTILNWTGSNWFCVVLFSGASH